MDVRIVLDCADPDSLATFWAQALGYRRTGYAEPYVILSPREGVNEPEIILQRVPEPKTVKNRMHLDLPAENVDTEVDRLIALGAARVTTDAIEEDGVRWVVMTDPEGNEFCVISR